MNENIQQLKEGILKQKSLYEKLLELGKLERKAIEERRAEDISTILQEKQGVMNDIGKIQESMPQDEALYNDPDVVPHGRELAAALHAVMKKEKENNDLLLVHMEEIRRGLMGVAQQKQIHNAYQKSQRSADPRVIDKKK